MALQSASPRRRPGLIAAVTTCAAIFALMAASWPPAKIPSADNDTKPAVTAEPLGRHSDAVYAVAVGQVNGRPIAVTGGADATVRVWDLTTRKPLGQPMTG
ncbi:hypothetical protein, partial [Streptosporangium sp. NPDC006930]